MIPLIVLIIVIGYSSFMKNHKFVLPDNSTLKSSQISPVFGTVKVSVDKDTSVVFVDVETKEKFTIDSITDGLTEKIKLEKGHWYIVEGAGNITVSPVVVRIE
ncbi:hypothetical protein HMPREF0629_01280 [Peptoniphilus sp. oral taxon 386 str. F0131]|nr:hypothetical protein HMPREF0629_01280 [Peptoniphilus sp. oral taxon 386 str. F0131]